MEQGVPLLSDQTARSGNESLPEDDDISEAPLKLSSPGRWTRVKERSIKTLTSLLPTYIQPGKHTTKKELHPTAYLDALRGYAAFIVFMYHGFGVPNIWFLHLPIIRVFFGGGPGMVAIFFVISGYVLSYRMLKMMRNKEPTRLLDSLASSTFRRFIRLYGSTGVATFISMLTVQLGWWTPSQLVPSPTFFKELWHWCQDFVMSSDPFANVEGWVHEGVFRTMYLEQMWTIPIEYRGSIILFVFCAASCKLSVRSRMVFLWVVVLLCYYWRAIFVAEFLFGMFIAELSFNRHPERLGRLPQVEISEKPPQRRWQSVVPKVGYSVLLVLGLILLGQPDFGKPLLFAFPWQYLLHFIPPWYGDAAYTFWLSFGAFFVVLAIDSYPALQTPFTWSFSQYLGELSFGIYAMHVPIVWSLYKGVLEPFRQLHLGQSTFAYLPGPILTAIVVLWAADYFTRIDRIVVRLGRVLETKTFVKWES